MGTTKKKAPTKKPAAKKKRGVKPDIIMVNGKPYDRNSALGPPVEFPESWTKPSGKKPKKKRSAMERLRAGEQVSGQDIIAERGDGSAPMTDEQLDDMLDATSPDGRERLAKRGGKKPTPIVDAVNARATKQLEERTHNAMPPSNLPPFIDRIAIGATVFMQWDPSGPANDLFPGAGAVRRAKLVGWTKDGKPKAQMFRVDSHGSYTGELGSEVRTFEVSDLLGQVHSAIYMDESAVSYDQRIERGGTPTDAQLLDQIAKRTASNETETTRATTKKIRVPKLKEAETVKLGGEGGTFPITKVETAAPLVASVTDPRCPTHGLLLIPTRSKTQRVCPAPGSCGFYSKKLDNGTFSMPQNDDTASVSPMPAIETDDPPWAETTAGTPGITVTIPRKVRGSTKDAKTSQCPKHTLALVLTADKSYLLCPVGDCDFALYYDVIQGWIESPVVADVPAAADDVMPMLNDEPTVDEDRPPWE